MNAAKSLIIIRSDAPIKKGIHYLFLLACLMLTHFSALAQQYKPKWVDDFRGASGSGQATSLAIDKQNNVYVTGQFQGSVDFDPSAGVKNLVSAGLSDIFIGKYKVDGTLLWVESFGGSAADYPYSVSVDKDGNVTIAGSFNSTTLDADPGPGVYNLDNPSGYDAAFIIHLDTNGNFLWANSFSGPESFGAFQVAADSQDNVIVTSYFGETLTIGDSSYRANNIYDGLIIKYSASGNLLWSIRLNSPDGNGYDFAFGAAVDHEDYIIISGSINSTVNFNPLGTALNLKAANGNNSAFVAKYSPSGILSWVNAINSTSQNFINNSAVCIDTKNNIYFGTPFDISITFGTSTLNSVPNSKGINICFAKYSPTGVFKFAKALGGQGTFSPGAVISSDNDSNIYLTGYFTGTTNFNPNPGKAENLSPYGRDDIYVAKYDSTGNYQYAFNLGSANSYMAGTGIGVDGNQNIDLGGNFGSTVNFDPTGCSSDNVTASSASDAFLAQYTSAALANDIITPPPITSFCTSGMPAAITGSTPTGGSGTYTYQWQSSADSVTFTNITGATGQNYTPATLTATTYYQRVVSSVCTTPVASNIVSLTIAPTPPAPTVAAATTCNGSTATLSVTAPQQGITYNWYAGATGDTTLFTGTTFTTPALNAAATYYAAAVNSTGCSSATRAAVTVSILPALAAPVVTVGPTTSSTVIFTWAAVPGATGYQVSTDGGQTYSPPGGGPLALTDTVSGLQGGQSVTLTVEATGSIACQVSTASAAATGQAISPTDDIIYVPNAFTPNGDGRNDQAHVHGENIQSLKFYIYDQWGELLFTSLNQQNGWDGTYKGSKEPAGVYVYYLEAIMNDGQNIKKKGTITLLK